MLVRCPKCRTTYKISDEVVNSNKPTFRCSRCRHTFELEPHNPESPAVKHEENGAESVGSDKDEELRLPFEARGAAVDGTKADRSSLEGVQSTRELNASTGDDKTDRWSMSDSERDDDASFVMPQSDRPREHTKVLGTPQDFPDDDPFFPKHDVDEETADGKNILALSQYLDQRASILPFVSLFGLLLIAFAVITVISHAHPQASENMIRQIPLVGSSMLKNEHLKEGIVIDSLLSAYQTIQGNREVFLITGIVHNQNPVVIQEIRLTGVTYGEEGKELERQTIWAGNTISPKIIRGMTPEDIPHLQDLKPLKSFEVAPGDSIPFTIVFLRSAKNAKQFSCEVLAAEGEV